MSHTLHPSSIAEMKAFLDQYRVSYTDCVEKSDLLRRCAETRERIQRLPAIVNYIPVGERDCNACIVADPATKEAVLIDPGDEPRRILQLIRDMGVTVKQILITHAHWDKFLAAEEIRKETKAPLLLHRDDMPLWGLVVSKTPGLSSVRDPDGFLSDGMKLAVRGGVVMHTPGHTAGSCCFYFPRDRMVYTGDALLAGYASDLLSSRPQLPREMHDAIRLILRSLPEETRIIPGREEETTVGREAKAGAIVKPKIVPQPKGIVDSEVAAAKAAKRNRTAVAAEAAARQNREEHITATQPDEKRAREADSSDSKSTMPMRSASSVVSPSHPQSDASMLSRSASATASVSADSRGNLTDNQQENHDWEMAQLREKTATLHISPESPATPHRAASPLSAASPLGAASPLSRDYTVSTESESTVSVGSSASNTSSSSSASARSGKREVKFDHIEEIPVGELENQEHQLGRGGCGMVDLYYWTDRDMLVAVKKALTPEHQPALQKECEILHSLRHPFVVPVLGVCHPPQPNSKRLMGDHPRAPPTTSTWVVMEYMPNGSLDSYIKSAREKNREISLSQRLQWCYECARAINHLHKLQTGTDGSWQHRDIKPHNFLLTKHLEVKLSDFGLAEIRNSECDQSTVTANGMCTLHYAAPEVGQGTKYSHAADVYSLGILIYWVCTGLRPYRDVDPRVEVRKGLRPTMPEWLDEAHMRPLRTLIENCWHEIPTQRPTCRTIMTELTNFKKSLEPEHH